MIKKLKYKKNYLKVTWLPLLADREHGFPWKEIVRPSLLCLSCSPKVFLWLANLNIIQYMYPVLKKEKDGAEETFKCMQTKVQLNFFLKKSLKNASLQWLTTYFSDLHFQKLLHLGPVCLSVISSSLWMAYKWKAWAYRANRQADNSKATSQHAEGSGPENGTESPNTTSFAPLSSRLPGCHSSSYPELQKLPQDPNVVFVPLTSVQDGLVCHFLTQLIHQSLDRKDIPTPNTFSPLNLQTQT